MRWKIPESTWAMHWERALAWVMTGCGGLHNFHGYAQEKGIDMGDDHRAEN
jgi:hypothetical protein